MEKLGFIQHVTTRRKSAEKGNVILCRIVRKFPDNKVHGASMGPIRGRQDPGGPHVGPINFAIWDGFDLILYCKLAYLCRDLFHIPIAYRKH